MRNHQKLRLARLVIHLGQLEDYKETLQEEIEASLKKDPGVLTLNAVSEKEYPHHITILEIDADEAAYQAHLKTHILKVQGRYPGNGGFSGTYRNRYATTVN